MSLGDSIDRAFVLPNASSRRSRQAVQVASEQQAYPQAFNPHDKKASAEAYPREQCNSIIGYVIVVLATFTIAFSIFEQNGVVTLY